MNEIADASFDPEAYRQVLGVIARRLQEKDERWRCCYKALLLLEHLLKHGPPKIISDIQSSMTVLDRLQRFQYKDENGRDHGANVRHRAKEVAELASDAERLRIEREKAKANRSKYRGVSAAEMRGGGFGNKPASMYGGIGGHGSSSVSTSRPGDSWGAPSISPKANRPSYSYSSELEQPTFKSAPSDFHHISPAKPAESNVGNEEDAVAATQKRIEKLRLAKAEEEKRVASQMAKEVAGKKKLTDVKVNPKIAASLGLKPVFAPSAPVAATSNPGDSYPDLLAVDNGNNRAASEGILPTQPPASALEDLLGSDNGGWDAFGSSNAQQNVEAPLTLDPFSALDVPPVTSLDLFAAAQVSQKPPQSLSPSLMQQKKTNVDKKDPFSDLLQL